METTETVESVQKKPQKVKLPRTFEANPLYDRGRYFITQKNGKIYSFRVDTRRYFFPNEWNRFIKIITDDKHRLFFITLINTGARAMEALHLKPKNFDFERETVTFEIIKQRKAKKTFYATGISRTFFVSPEYLKEVKKYIREKNIEPNSYFFLNNATLPPNYEELSNLARRKYYSSSEVAYRALMRRKLKLCGIKDYKNFGLHAVRKTYGQYMRTCSIDLQDIVYRMGHDIATYISNYGSSLIFTDEEKLEIKKILGHQKSVISAKME